MSIFSYKLPKFVEAVTLSPALLPLVLTLLLSADQTPPISHLLQYAGVLLPVMLNEFMIQVFRMD